MLWQSAEDDWLLETPHPLADWVAAAKPGIGGARRAGSQQPGLQLQGQGRNGDCSLVTGSACGELEDTTAATVACWTDYPADQFAVARRRCNQWAERGAEAGREVHPPSAPYRGRWSPGRFSAWRSPSSNE